MKADCLSILQWKLKQDQSTSQWSMQDTQSGLYLGFSSDRVAIEAVSEEVFWEILPSPPPDITYYQ